MVKTHYLRDGNDFSRDVQKVDSLFVLHWSRVFHPLVAVTYMIKPEGNI